MSKIFCLGKTALSRRSVIILNVLKVFFSRYFIKAKVQIPAVGHFKSFVEAINAFYWQGLMSSILISTEHYQSHST